MVIFHSFLYVYQRVWCKKIRWDHQDPKISKGCTERPPGCPTWCLSPAGRNRNVASFICESKQPTCIYTHCTHQHFSYILLYSVILYIYIQRIYIYNVHIYICIYATFMIWCKQHTATISQELTTGIDIIELTRVMPSVSPGLPLKGKMHITVADLGIQFGLLSAASNALIKRYWNFKHSPIWPSIDGL